MNQSAFVEELPNGRQAVALRTGVDADPASIAEALELPTSSAVLLLSGGAGLMSRKVLNRVSALFAAVAQALAEERITVIDGGTQAGVMALMGEALAKAGFEDAAVDGLYQNYRTLGACSSYILSDLLEHCDGDVAKVQQFIDIVGFKGVGLEIDDVNGSR